MLPLPHCNSDIVHCIKSVQIKILRPDTLFNKIQLNSSTLTYTHITLPQSKNNQPGLRQPYFSVLSTTIIENSYIPACEALTAVVQMARITSKHACTDHIFYLNLALITLLLHRKDWCVSRIIVGEPVDFGMMSI